MRWKLHVPVLTGGKFERTYLSELARGMYYGSVAILVVLRELCPKLPNSGKTLKLMVPNSCSSACRVVSLTTFSGRETTKPLGHPESYKEMDNRGSKLCPEGLIKEQRLDGSRQVSGVSCLRFSLTGLERNYKVKIPSKQINKVRFYSTHDVDQTQKLIMNPWFLTGFCDAESSFTIRIRKQQDCSTGWAVLCGFYIELHAKDQALLEKIQKYFGAGKISYSSRRGEAGRYRIESLKDLLIIINHFDKYPLLTHKLADYKLFKQALELMKRKEHLTKDGIRKLVSIKASQNLGISSALESAFENIIPVERPLVVEKKVPDPNWLAGFTSGEGSFMVRVKPSKTMTLGFRVLLVFQLTQHHRDEQLLRSLAKFWDCGKVYKRRDEVFDLKVQKLTDINEIIIPFFQRYKIMGVKHLDFQDFCKVAELMKNKAHLTRDGLDRIRKIKKGMNTGRRVRSN